MKAQYIKQISKEELVNTKFDLVITSSGYEERSSYIANLISQNARTRIVFAFTDYDNNKIRMRNDVVFESLNYTFFKADGSNSTIIKEIIEHYLSDSSIEKILIDYSSMTRIWYSSIINFFRNLEIDNRVLHVYYAYSCAKFDNRDEKNVEEKDRENVNEKDEFRLSHFDPIEDYFYLTPSDVPTALITCLGAEPNNTYGLKEYFDAELLYLFYSEKNEFAEFIKEKNKALLDETLEKYKIPYYIDDIIFTKTILFDLCKTLMKDHRVIIAPCGPKVFTLISLLVASELEEIDVWRISRKPFKPENQTVNASQKVITCNICYKKLT